MYVMRLNLIFIILVESCYRCVRKKKTESQKFVAIEFEFKLKIKVVVRNVHHKRLFKVKWFIYFNKKNRRKLKNRKLCTKKKQHQQTHIQTCDFWGTLMIIIFRIILIKSKLFRKQTALRCEPKLLLTRAAHVYIIIIATDRSIYVQFPCMHVYVNLKWEQ